ncbi:MAG TPA: type IV secretion system DNA-binding domain-containing protein [Steroidobacteraceae bacterium]|nr:type IV secretion system DNA-binding domain-containing protein [Steroidobacteraceae bacterium]
MPAQLHGLTHGTRGVALAYTLVVLAMLAALIRARAPVAKLLIALPLAAPLTALAGLLAALTSILLDGSEGPVEGSAGEAILAGWGAAICALIGYAAGRILAARARSRAPLHLRGAVVAPGGGAGAPPRPSPAPRDSPVTLAGLAIAAEDETKHFKLIGTTGTGKSTAIHEMLSAALARGDRAIIADPDGGYRSRFYDPARGDVILNPFDRDARKWDLFGEISNDYDAEQLARSLIPESGDADRSWSEYARTFVSALAHRLIAGDSRDDRLLYELTTSASVTTLREMLLGTPAGPFLEKGNERMFGSIRSIASSAVRALQYTTRQQAEPISVRQWVRSGAARRSGGSGGVLFLPYRAGEIAALGSAISAWMRLGIFEALDRGEGDQRLWFVIDELDALGAIDGLKDALARLRKFGGRCILGFQSIAQVSGTYGRGVAETIVENCGNTLILRCSASEHGGTSEFASRLIGQREVLHTTLSRTRRSGDLRGSTTASESVRIEPTVMASEIERLADLTGFLKLASLPDWQAVRIAPLSEGH